MGTLISLYGGWTHTVLQYTPEPASQGAQVRHFTQVDPGHSPYDRNKLAPSHQVQFFHFGSYYSHQGRIVLTTRFADTAKNQEPETNNLQVCTAVPWNISFCVM